MITWTTALLEAAGLDELSAGDSLIINAAIEWLADNTDLTVTVDATDVSNIAALSAGAHLFIGKYVAIMKSRTMSGGNVTSESIGGMSHSFGTASDSESGLWILARQLLGGHITGGVKIVPDISPWVP